MSIKTNDTISHILGRLPINDHGAFNDLYRWSARHMFTEFFLGAVLVYLQLTDERAGRWSAAAAILSLVGASIPSFFFSSAPGWRMNFVLQILVIFIRIAVVTYIVWWFADEWQDMELASNRICQLATILLSMLSLSPLIYMSITSSWLITMQPGEDLYTKNVPPRRRQRAMIDNVRSAECKDQGSSESKDSHHGYLEGETELSSEV